MGNEENKKVKIKKVVIGDEENKVELTIKEKKGGKDLEIEWREGEDRVAMEYHTSHGEPHVHYRYINTEAGVTVRTHPYSAEEGEKALSEFLQKAKEAREKEEKEEDS